MRASPSASPTAIRTFHQSRQRLSAASTRSTRRVPTMKAAMRLRAKVIRRLISAAATCAQCRATTRRAIADLRRRDQTQPEGLGRLSQPRHRASAEGRLTGAAVTIDAAVRQWPNDVPVYANRGFTRFAAGDFAGAAADLSASQGTFRPMPMCRCGVICHAPASARRTPRSSSATQTVDRTAWPAPVLDLFLGQAKPDAVRAAAAEGDAAGRADRECEASFYLGEFALLDGRREDALGLLRQAGDQCPAGFTERAAARGEAARLAK